MESANSFLGLRLRNSNVIHDLGPMVSLPRIVRTKRCHCLTEYQGLTTIVCCWSANINAFISIITGWGEIRYLERIAVFSNVSTTGNVSGSWTAEAIGGVHPSNDAAPMYVVVTDSSGRETTIPHTDPAVTIRSAWEPWLIPLADLSPVSLGAITSVTIGVGHPGALPNGARGTV